MTRFRTAARLARRLAFAKKSRAVLVIALVGIPMVGMSAASVVIASRTPSTAETLRADLGNAQARVQATGQDLPGLTQDPVDMNYDFVRDGSPAAKSDGSAPIADPRSVVPPGVRSIVVRTGSVQLDGPKVPVSIDATSGATWSRALDGHWRVLSGRTPRSGAEAMVTPATLARLDAGIGDTVTMTHPTRHTFTIVGTMRDLTTTRDAQGFFAPESALPGLDADLPSDEMVYLPDHALTWSEIEAANAHGIVVESRPVVLDPPSDVKRKPDLTSYRTQYALVALVGGFALFEIGLLAAAAFLVGTRADTRTHAILSSVGGDRRFLFAVVSGAGATLAAVGAVAGTLLGIGAGALLVRVLDNGSVASWPGLHVPWLVLGGVAVAGTLVGWASSLVAARSASRVDAIAALRGATRPPTSAHRRRRGRIAGPLILVVGILLTIASGAAVLWLDDQPSQKLHDLALPFGIGVGIGSCLAQLGAILYAPALLAGITNVAARFGVAARMAVRDARRNPVRTVPVLASVMSVVFLATALGTYTVSAQDLADRTYEFRTAVGVATSSVQNSAGEADAGLTARAAAAMRKAMPGHPIRVLASTQESAVVTNAGKPVAGGPDAVVPHLFHSVSGLPEYSLFGSWLQGTDSSAPHILVGTESDLAVLLGRSPSRAASEALASGKAVALWPQFVDHGAVRIDSFTPRQAVASGSLPIDTDPDHSVAIPAVVDVPDPRIEMGVFMTAATAARYGVPATPSLLVTTMAAAPSPTESDDLTAAWEATAGADAVSWSPYWSYEGGPSDAATTVLLVLVAVALAVVLAATWVAIGLARSDGRRDDEVLDAVGAPPRLRRAVASWQAALLTGVGAVVGTVLGLLPVRAMTLRFVAPPKGTEHMAFVVDPRLVVLLVVVLPAIVTFGVWATSGGARRPSLRRAG